MNHYIVKVTDARHEQYEIEKRILERIGAELIVCHCESEEDLIAQCGDADGLLLDMAPMTKEVVRQLKKCRVISRYGVGYDNLDVAACTENAIWACNVPDYCAQDVSDHAVALLFSCLRQTVLRDRLIRQGQWNISYGKSFRLSGKTLGVLGCGQIGRALIQKLSGFCLKEVLVYDPYVTKETAAALGARKCSFEEILQCSDILSLHMPVTPATTKIINRQAFAQMKDTAILINTSRGGLVEEEALLDALQHGKILGAGLDTYCREPLPKDSPFFQLPNVVLTDHTAFNTVEGVQELKEKAAANVASVLTGKTPAYPINHLDKPV